ncbi:YidC/Oxa1 family membrane protein insertase [Actinoallomurus iriomotensis]|uniref:Membrane protein insertase YidC n=1 Tax=Actinoallomurus iriomotensis TaxID=478107 RepID=A0A9W6SF20_9ACTN|nr:membrane protein insertase YidC [Actinoallomurus iriomotensis]GLY91652.1 protein translocase component YidC [Actinoallomurus iriomotensis]
MFALFDAAVGVAYHLVTGLMSLLEPLTGGLSAAVAVIAFTACVRLALLPLSVRQARANQARLRLEPQVKKLRERHRADPVRAHQEIGALYRAEGTSMWAGIGPSLLQMPVFAVVYRIFLSPVVGGHANLLLAHTLLGTPLGARWLLSAGAFGPHGLVFLGLFALLAVVAWWTSRQAPTPPGPLGRVTRVLPYGTLLIAAYVPLAAGLYVLTTTLWTAAERASLWRTPAGT